MSSEEERMSEDERLAEYVEAKNIAESSAAGKVDPVGGADFILSVLGTPEVLAKKFSAPPLRPTAKAFSPSYFHPAGTSSAARSEREPSVHPASEADHARAPLPPTQQGPAIESLTLKVGALTAEVASLTLKINNLARSSEKRDDEAVKNYNAMATYIQRLEEQHKRDTADILAAISRLELDFATPPTDDGYAHLVPPSPPPHAPELWETEGGEAGFVAPEDLGLAPERPLRTSVPRVESSAAPVASRRRFLD